jgi:hypothetical protein
MTGFSFKWTIDPMDVFMLLYACTARQTAEPSAECSPMLCIPVYPCYETETELGMSGEATGGLILFFNDKIYSIP